MTGHPDEAVANWQKSLELDPSNAEAEMEMGAVLVEKGQVEEGLSHLRKAVEMAPDTPDTHNALGWELAKAGRMDEAVAQLQKAVALAPASAEYYSNLGYVLELHGDSTQAVTAFEKAAQLTQEKEPRALTALADAYAKTGRFDEAIQTADRALEIALQTHDGELEKRVRDDLSSYAREREKAKSQL